MNDSLLPIHFFEVGGECYYVKKSSEKNFGKDSKYRLPHPSFLTGETNFSDVAIGWQEKGIFLEVNVHKPFEKVSYPRFQDGDCVELFFDTRDMKTAGGITRFCHHFFFLPEKVEGKQAGEITRFRGDDKHDLLDEKELLVKTSFHRDHYVLNIFIPENGLFGYDPNQFKRLGFTYRISAPRGLKQHFSAVSSEYPLELLPSLWSSLKLV